MISVTNLSKSYGTVKAVDDISFNVEKGKIVGFLGPNGAGKSTTLKILTGYIPPNSGSVEIAGINVIENSLEARKKIGYLPETTAIYKNMKVLEYLNFIADIREIPSEKRREYLDYVIYKLGLNNIAYKPIKILSKGYKQRVGLAQALIHKPDILILDEPTSGLDPNQVIEIRELIKEIGRDKTVIFSTHILQEVEALCDDILIINKGKIAASGTKNELGKDSRNFLDIIIKGKNDNINSIFTQDSDILSIRKGVFEDNSTRYEIESKTDIREKVFNLSKDNGIVLLEMKSRTANLEEIFKKLTN